MTSKFQIPIVLRNFLIGYMCLHFLAAGILVVILSKTLRTRMIEDTRRQMTAMAKMLSEHIHETEAGLTDPSLPEHLKRLGKETKFRFTVILPNGSVVADSETGTKDIGDHGDRPEILAASLDAPGFSTRYSSTLEIPMMYLANTHHSRVNDTQGVVRVAIPSVAINSAISSLQAYILVFALSLSLLACILTVLFSTYLLRPLSQFSEAAKQIGIGQYASFPKLLNRNDEWGSLADAFGQMQNELSIRERGIVSGRDRLEAVLTSMIEGVLAIDSSKKVALANRAVCDMFSLHETDLVNRNFIDVIRTPELSAAIEKTQATSEQSKIEFETPGISERRKISARVTVLPQESSSDLRPGIVAVLHDVTELRQLENLRRDFVANVSHELKTPLTSIKACAETLRLGAIHDERKNMFFLKQIESNADVLDLQIQDLLQLARVESGKENWQIESIAINDLCQQCILQFESEAEKRNVTLRYSSNSNSPMIKADYEAILTILNNLISNALHYTPEGGEVELSNSVIGDEIVLKIADTGIGIPAEHQSRIFERFYRVDRARSRELGGSGLGLAIVKHLANAFGGQAEVESQPGKGSIFTVRLPSANEPH